MFIFVPEVYVLCICSVNRCGYWCCMCTACPDHCRQCTVNGVSGAVECNDNMCDDGYGIKKADKTCTGMQWLMQDFPMNGVHSSSYTVPSPFSRPEDTLLFLTVVDCPSHTRLSPIDDRACSDAVALTWTSLPHYVTSTPVTPSVSVSKVASRLSSSGVLPNYSLRNVCSWLHDRWQ